MSNRSRRKGKDSAKAMFVESSAPMTKSKNMAEENILRHKLKGLEDQRRRSILALKGEEKMLIKDLETQRRGSQTLQATDIDKLSNNQDHLHVKHANSSRRGSCISSDENDNTLNPIAMRDLAKNARLGINQSNGNNDKNDTESRKHLWKHPKPSTTPSRGDTKPLPAQNSKTCPTRTQSNNDRLHMSDIVKEHSSERDKGHSSDSILSPADKTNGSNQNNDILSRPRNRTLTSSRSLLWRTKSIDIDCIERPCANEEMAGVWPDNTRQAARNHRPTKPRTKSEERRDRSLTTLKKQPGSFRLSSFEDLDKELSSAYGMIDKHAQKLSRSVKKNAEDDSNENANVSSALLSKSTPDYNSLNNRLTKNIKQLSNNLQNCSLSSLQSNPSMNGKSTTRNSACTDISNKSLQRSLDKLDVGVDQHRRSRHQTNQTESLNSVNDTNPPLPPQTDLKPSNLSERRNSVGRNKILLSPITPRTPRLPTDGYVPSCVEKRVAKKPSKKRRSTDDTKEPLKMATGNQVASDSDSGGSCMSRRGSIPDSHVKSSTTKASDLPVRPVSSWSQRKRSIVFGEKSPQTAREVLNDTHAQWEELGDFLGEIRKQHNKDHSRPMSSARRNPKPEQAPNRHECQPRRESSSFATLVDQRLLPRRHSESNIILLSHAAQGKKDILDVRRGSVSRHSRRKSCIPPDQSCDIIGHASTNSTTVKKLVTIHNALQTSALSMADMESEMF